MHPHRSFTIRYNWSPRILQVCCLLLVEAAPYLTTQALFVPQHLAPKGHKGRHAVIDSATYEETASSTICAIKPIESNDGKLLVARDIFYDKAAANALEQIRSSSSGSSLSSKADKGSGDEQTMSLGDSKFSKKDADAFTELSSSGDWDKTTLTLVGYKGGPRDSQVNQDRSILISPFMTSSIIERRMRTAANQRVQPRNLDGQRIKTKLTLIGVFDGHGSSGEVVSEYARTEIPKRLSQKFRRFLSVATSEKEVFGNEVLIRQIIKETFIEVDETTPEGKYGGCSASIALQVGNKLYIANAGDSTTLVACASCQQLQYRSKAYQKLAAQTGATSLEEVSVLYETREDKPHLPEERERIEACGGSVSIPENEYEDDTSRVVYEKDGCQVGLAMSRSIGDHDAPGVIPDPIIDVLDIPSLIETNDHVFGDDEQVRAPKKHLFVVSATDGLADYIHSDDIAKVMASSFQEHHKNENKYHPHVSAEQLIYVAAKGWARDMGGQYRDDITIAASTITLENQHAKNINATRVQPRVGRFQHRVDLS